MDELEKYFHKLRNLFYQSKVFAFGLVAVLVLVTIAFPGLMALIVATTLVFLFIKGMMLLISMINDR